MRGRAGTETQDGGRLETGQSVTEGTGSRGEENHGNVSGFRDNPERVGEHGLLRGGRQRGEATRQARGRRGGLPAGRGVRRRPAGKCPLPSKLKRRPLPSTATENRVKYLHFQMHELTR